jgi:hypothetical protein
LDAESRRDARNERAESVKSRSNTWPVVGRYLLLASAKMFAVERELSVREG